ncbi:MAG: hypothetical protein DMF22_00845 [Verrucomicrobia bacterium]|nr:MAG: hypothetical protein DME68_04245 [Verrucomicrobiota bacterium]PYL73709.1 MAG: hypothetical protein DMF22_00845 [Verrucomicrobiota bacterium]
MTNSFAADRAHNDLCAMAARRINRDFRNGRKPSLSWPARENLATPRQQASRPVQNIFKK